MKHRRSLQDSFQMSMSTSTDTDTSADSSSDSGGNPDLGGIDIFACFSEKATVQVQGVTDPISMKDLAVGDYALTNDGTYQMVYAWGHFNPSKDTTFLQIYTASSSKPLEITGEHLIYLEGKNNPVRADSVKAGDVLKSAGTARSEIKKVRQITRTGAYTPLTTTGKIVVDKIHASSYISLQNKASEFVQLKGVDTLLPQQDGIHLVLSPFRMLCMGVSSSLCQAADDEGIPHYVASGMCFLRWADTALPLWIQAPLLCVAFVVFGVCFLWEVTVGASTLPSFLLVTGLICAISKFCGLAVRATKAKAI